MCMLLGQRDLGVEYLLEAGADQMPKTVWD
jgi:hypothetical protein